MTTKEKDKYRIVSCHKEIRIQVRKKRWLSDKPYWGWHIIRLPPDGLLSTWQGSLEEAKKENECANQSNI